MNPIDDEKLMAYLDGELDELNRARVEAALTSDAELRERLDAQRRLRERLSAHYEPVTKEAIPDRFREMLESQVVDLFAARARRARPPLWQTAVAIAATLVFGILLGRSWPGETGPVAFDGGTMVAQGALAEALETQLASAQLADAPTRIGVSFARPDGRACRTFETAAMAGLACREGAGWQLMMTAAARPAQQGEFRQAGSDNAVMSAAQEMMAGEPFDAESERRARDRGWRIAAPRD